MARHYVYPTANPDGSNTERRIELHWQRELYVQIGSTAWKGEPGKPDTGLDFLPEPLKVLAQPAESSGLPRAWQGEFVDLTRDQINHLIKQLRAARDQAYGRDE